MEILWQIILIILLVLLNGYFVASEFALVAIRKTRIDELVKKGNQSAKLVQKALSDLDSYISSTQLGITIASLALGWVGEPAVAGFLEPYLNFLPKNIAVISSHTLSTVIAFSTITFLHVVLGELAPKTIALQKADKVALIIITPLIVFTKIFKPLIWILNGAGKIVLKLMGFKAPTGRQLVHSEEEIKMILAQSVESGEIEKKEAEMVNKMFKFGDIPIQQIMLPRTGVVAFETTKTLKDLLKKVKNSRYSRFPVYVKSIDNIIGFVHIKDIYDLALESKSELQLQNSGIIREIISVPETKRADEVLLDMKRRRIHIGVVIDEYGGTSGIVTMEDILESIVGEIEDEFEKPKEDIYRQKDGSYLIDGFTSIDRLQQKFRLPLKGQGYVTVGGLVFGILGRTPKVGDSVQIGNITLKIELVDGRRIKTLRLNKKFY